MNEQRHFFFSISDQIVRVDKLQNYCNNQSCLFQNIAHIFFSQGIKIYLLQIQMSKICKNRCTNKTITKKEDRCFTHCKKIQMLNSAVSNSVY